MNADLSKCQFLDTDLRKVHLVGVTWCQTNSESNGLSLRRFAEWLFFTNRTKVFDEIVELTWHTSRPYTRIEALYRHLKQNHDEQLDHLRAGDFHYGEKEMQRRNTENRRSLRILLNLYRCFSGYGERMLNPFLFVLGLWGLSTSGYILLEIGRQEELFASSSPSWAIMALYSLRVMFFLRPEDYALSGWAEGLYFLQTLFGPFLLGLLAFTVRQKLKR